MKIHISLRCFAIIMVALMVLQSCRKKEDPLPIDPVDIKLTSDQLSLVSSGNSFALDIFRKVAENAGQDENIVVSPLSISVALSMTLNGASGETRQAMLECLRSAGITPEVINDSYKKLTEALLSVDKRVLISIANSVWTENNFAAKQQFIDILTQYYDAEAKTFDINDKGTPAKINSWIEGKTNGLIREMVDKLDPDIVMILINAIYFKGQWNSQFEKSNTVNETFFTPSSQVSVPMMKQKHEYEIHRSSNFVLAEFPYGQGNYVMDVILPDEQNGVNSIVKDLTADTFNQITQNLNSQEVNVSFPRFKYGYKKQLNAILSDMGMAIAFDPYKADFSNISDQQLYINKVLHQAFIETNEEGTEAAAATVVEIGLTSAGPLNVFRMDHPFMYIIREVTTNSILFMGRVSNPAN